MQWLKTLVEISREAQPYLLELAIFFIFLYGLYRVVTVIISGRHP